jgi:hypothetical protein
MAHEEIQGSAKVYPPRLLGYEFTLLLLENFI